MEHIPGHAATGTAPAEEAVDEECWCGTHPKGVCVAITGPWYLHPLCLSKAFLSIFQSRFSDKYKQNKITKLPSHWDFRISPWPGLLPSPSMPADDSGGHHGVNSHLMTSSRAVLPLFGL